jgi:crotonobetainyl-CoA:carnitine CoA-transferase CaiB-like acyl-CoA transferase
MTEPAQARPHRPFEGLKVIDCASFIAAPVAATLLADLGADVIKIEAPEGDPYRRTYLTVGLPASDRNYPWEVDNRNKRALCLDLKRTESAEVLRRLVLGADVFITNLPLPVRERLGLAAATVRSINPRLVYASFTAYGESGPEAGKPGFDATAYWARSGLMDLVKPDHTAPPSRPTMGMGDHPSATAFFGAIVTALYDRERTGRGAEVRSSLLANGLWSNAIMVQGQLNGLQFAPRPPREFSPNPFGNLYQCADGRWLNLTLSSEEKQFPLLMQALGLHDYAQRPMLASLQACRDHHTDTIAEFDRRFAQHPLAYWRCELDSRGLTFGVIGTLADIDDDEQMRASGALVPFADGDGLTVNSPFDVVGVDKVAPRRAPTLGADNAQVLAELGYSAQEIAQLQSDGVIRRSV